MMDAPFGKKMTLPAQISLFVLVPKQRILWPYKLSRIEACHNSSVVILEEGCYADKIKTLSRSPDTLCMLVMYFS